MDHSGVFVQLATTIMTHGIVTSRELHYSTIVHYDRAYDRAVSELRPRFLGRTKDMMARQSAVYLLTWNLLLLLRAVCVQRYYKLGITSIDVITRKVGTLESFAG